MMSRRLLGYLIGVLYDSFDDERDIHTVITQDLVDETLVIASEIINDK